MKRAHELSIRLRPDSVNTSHCVSSWPHEKASQIRWTAEASRVNDISRVWPMHTAKQLWIEVDVDTIGEASHSWDASTHLQTAESVQKNSNDRLSEISFIDASHSPEQSQRRWVFMSRFDVLPNTSPLMRMCIRRADPAISITGVVIEYWLESAFHFNVPATPWVAQSVLQKRRSVLSLLSYALIVFFTYRMTWDGYRLIRPEHKVEIY